MMVRRKSYFTCFLMLSHFWVTVKRNWMVNGYCYMYILLFICRPLKWLPIAKHETWLSVVGISPKYARDALYIRRMEIVRARYGCDDDDLSDKLTNIRWGFVCVVAMRPVRFVRAVCNGRLLSNVRCDKKVACFVF